MHALVLKRRVPEAHKLWAEVVAEALRAVLALLVSCREVARRSTCDYRRPARCTGHQPDQDLCLDKYLTNY